MPEPDCPKCPFTPMEVVNLEKGLHVDECPQCHGRWYDHGELAKVVAHPDRLSGELARGMFRERPSASACPRCSKPMINGGLGSEFLRVDRCKEHGFWVDQNEVRVLNRVLSEL